MSAKLPDYCKAEGNKSVEESQIFTKLDGSPGISNLEPSNKRYSDNKANLPKDHIFLLEQEILKLEAAFAEKSDQLKANENKILYLTEELEKKNELLQIHHQEIETLQNLAKRGKKALIRTLRGLEEKKRQELKSRLFNDSFRIGRVTIVRSGTKFQEY